MSDSQSNDNVKKLNDAFCSLIFKQNALTREENDKLNNVVNSAIKLYEWHVPYELITEKIYGTDIKHLEEITNSVQEKLANISSESKSDNDKIIKLRFDTVRHIHLAIVQKKYIDSNIVEAQKELTEIKEVKGSIYSDFIAILGIFTAITFATFGGLELIGNVFGNIHKFTFVNIGGALMLGAIYLLGMYLILIALLIGVSKLNDRKYYLSNTSIYVISASFVTIFTVGFGLMNRVFSAKDYLAFSIIITHNNVDHRDI